MLSEIFLNSLLASMGLWLLLSITDSLLTVAGAKLYQGTREQFVFSGSYELEPEHQEDVDSYRAISFTFVLGLILYGGVLWIIYANGFKKVFAFVWGGLIFLQLAVHLRHFRNLLLFSYAKRSKGVAGQIKYERWLSLRLSAYEFLGYGLLFSIVFLFTGSLIILGGAVACSLMAIRHWLMAIKSSMRDVIDSRRA